MEDEGGSTIQTTVKTSRVFPVESAAQSEVEDDVTREYAADEQRRLGIELSKS